LDVEMSDGYREWTDHPEWGKRFLVVRSRNVDDPTRKRFDATSNPPNVFEEFAGTPATEEGILQFARRYGFLGRTWVPREFEAEHVVGEPFGR